MDENTEDFDENLEAQMANSINQIGKSATSNETITSLFQRIHQITNVVADLYPIIANPLLPENEDLEEYNDLIIFKILEEVYVFGQNKTFGVGLKIVGNNIRIGGVMYGLVLAGLVESVEQMNENGPEKFFVTEAGIEKMKEIYNKRNLIRDHCAKCDKKDVCDVYNLL